MTGARKSSKAAKKPQSTKHKTVTKKLQRTSTITETVKTGKQFLAKRNEVKSPSKKPSTPKPAAQASKPAAPAPPAAAPQKKVEKVVVKKANKKLSRSRTINETLKTAKTFLSSNKPKLTRKSTIQQTVEASKPVVKSRKSSKGRR